MIYISEPKLTSSAPFIFYVGAPGVAGESPSCAPTVHVAWIVSSRIQSVCSLSVPHRRAGYPRVYPRGGCAPLKPARTE